MHFLYVDRGDNHALLHEKRAWTVLSSALPLAWLLDRFVKPWFELEFRPLTSAVSACTWPLCVCPSGEQKQEEEKIGKCSKRRKEKSSKRQVVKGSICQMKA